MSQPAAAAEEHLRTSEENLNKKLNEQKILGNYTTPLVGQFLNLPKVPVVITCPACHIRAPSEVLRDLKWYNSTVNGIYSFIFVIFCCCFCRNFSHPCRDTDINHYCKNCGCYFGRVMKPKNYLKKTKAK